MDDTARYVDHARIERPVYVGYPDASDFEATSIGVMVGQNLETFLERFDANRRMHGESFSLSERTVSKTTIDRDRAAYRNPFHIREPSGRKNGHEPLQIRAKLRLD